MASDTRYLDVAAIGRFEAFIGSVGGLRKVAARMAVANGSPTPSKDQVESQVRRLTRVSSGSVTMATLNLIAEAVARPFDELLAMVSHQPDPACSPAATEPDTKNRRESETGSERWRAPETETGRLYQRLNEASDLTASRTNIVCDEPGLPVLTLNNQLHVRRDIEDEIARALELRISEPSFIVIDGEAGTGKSSPPSLSKRGVKPLQFYPRIGGRELPVGRGVFLVPLSLPGVDLRCQGFFVGNASVQAL